MLFGLQELSLLVPGITLICECGYVENVVSDHYLKDTTLFLYINKSNTCQIHTLAFDSECKHFTCAQIHSCSLL